MEIKKEEEIINNENKINQVENIEEIINLVMEKRELAELEKRKYEEQKEKLIAEINKYINVDSEKLETRNNDKLKLFLKILQDNAMPKSPEISLIDEIKQNKVYLLYISVLISLSFATGMIFAFFGL